MFLFFNTYHHSINTLFSTDEFQLFPKQRFFSLLFATQPAKPCRDLPMDYKVMPWFKSAYTQVNLPSRSLLVRLKYSIPLLHIGP